MAAETMSKIPPHSLEAEKSVLGSLLIDKDAIIKVGDMLDAKDFYYDNHATIYESFFPYTTKEPQ